MITRPGVSLRGAGPEQTTLWFVKSLTDMYGNSRNGGQFPENGDAAVGPMSEWMNAPGERASYVLSGWETLGRCFL